jgi:hypothetical protein
MPMDLNFLIPIAPRSSWAFEPGSDNTLTTTEPSASKISVASKFSCKEDAGLYVLDCAVADAAVP